MSSNNKSNFTHSTDEKYSPLDHEEDKYKLLRIIFYILIGLIIGFLISYLVYTFYINPSPSKATIPQGGIDSTVLDSTKLDHLKIDTTPKEKSVESLPQIDSFETIIKPKITESLKVFFESHEKEDRDRLNKVLSPNVKEYLNIDFKSKTDLLKQISIYWKRVKNEKNSINWKSLKIIELENKKSDAIFELKYEITSGREKNKMKLFNCKIRQDSNFRIESFKTELK